MTRTELLADIRVGCGRGSDLSEAQIEAMRDIKARMSRLQWKYKKGDNNARFEGEIFCVDIFDKNGKRHFLRIGGEGSFWFAPVTFVCGGEISI